MRIAERATLDVLLMVVTNEPWSPSQLGARVLPRIDVRAADSWELDGGQTVAGPVRVQIQRETSPAADCFAASDAVLADRAARCADEDAVQFDPRGPAPEQLRAFLSAIDRGVAAAIARRERVGEAATRHEGTDSEPVRTDDAVLPAAELDAMRAGSDAEPPATPAPEPTPVSNVSAVLAGDEASIPGGDAPTPSAPMRAIARDDRSRTPLPTRDDLPLAARLKRKETVVLTRRRRRRRVRLVSPIRLSEDTLH